MGALITFESNYKNMLKGKKRLFPQSKIQILYHSVATAGIAIVTLYVVFRRGD
jgi:hypothetical protein